MDVVAQFEQMEDHFRKIPEFLGLTPENVLGCKFVFGTVHSKRTWPEVMAGSVLGITQHAARHISIAVPKMRFGESFCERIFYYEGVWKAVDISGKTYEGTFVIKKS